MIENRTNPACPACKGEGWIGAKACTLCQGGNVQPTPSVKVDADEAWRLLDACRYNDHANEPHDRGTPVTVGFEATRDMIARLVRERDEARMGQGLNSAQLADLEIALSEMVVENLDNNAGDTGWNAALLEVMSKIIEIRTRHRASTEGASTAPSAAAGVGGVDAAAPITFVLDSPPFRPAALDEFEARGFERVNRTANPTVQRVQRTWQQWAAGEMDRMREALQAIHAWDMLNPADASVLADAPWLKKIVVDALTPAPGDEHEPPLVDAQPIAQDAHPYPATVEFLGPRSPQNDADFGRLHTLMLRVYAAGIEEQKRQAEHAALCASFSEQQPVTINMKLEARNYTDEGREKRRAGAKGKATGKFSDSHGLCFEIEHEDGTKAWYDLDELRKG